MSKKCQNSCLILKIVRWYLFNHFGILRTTVSQPRNKLLKMTGSGVERGNRGGVLRVLAKLDKSLEEGDFYEAHQMYRTLYFRYLAQRKYDECLELLYNGAQKLISKEQETSAADLGLLFLDTLEKRGGNTVGDTKMDEGDVKLWIDRLGSIIAQLNVSVVERETLINRALKWSGDVSGNNLGHPAMHKLIAQIFWTEGNIAQARHHYLLCRDGQLCGRVIIKIATTKGYKTEKDLFIVQAVLQQLCLKETSTAEDTFITYTTNHPHIRQSSAPFYLPLLNFLHFLFRSIEMGLGLNTFNTLRKIYKLSLDRDPSFDKYLNKIGMLYFGATTRPNQGGMFGGMFGDLFSRIFQDLDGMDDDEDGERQASELPGRGSVADKIQHDLD